jgi:hypothetical protein
VYREANETINEGMSLGARIMLGSVSALFGVVMILIAPPTDKQVYFYLFGAFCLFIALACFTRGRVRQFLGSTIGVVIFFAGVVYLIAELTSGVLWSGRRSEPSVYNAILYLLFIGVPGGVYAYRARFGFAKKP